MSTKTYHGSCQCRRIQFEADIDLAQTGTGKCNCTSCWKRRWWSTRAEPKNFRLTGGQQELTGYVAGSDTGHGGFCKHCGVTPYAWVDAADWNPAAYWSINVACLDDLDPGELMAAPIRYMDGRNDNWLNVPAEIRHL